MNIYLYINEKVEGPYTQDQLFNEVRKRSLPMSTLAKEEDAEEWVSVFQFFSPNEKPKNQSPSLESAGKSKAAKTPDAGVRLKIKNVETPLVVSIHSSLGTVFLCLAGLFLLVAFASPKESERQIILTLLVMTLSVGIGLIIAGILMGWIHECVVRLRNIELNTAKAAEKLGK
jgi:hypothetical protein